MKADARCACALLLRSICLLFRRFQEKQFKARCEDVVVGAGTALPFGCRVGGERSDEYVSAWAYGTDIQRCAIILETAVSHIRQGA